MDLSYEVAGDQSAGTRDLQDDAFFLTYLKEEEGEERSAALIVLADGTGWGGSSRIAATLAVSTFSTRFSRDFGLSAPPDLLQESLNAANERVGRAIREMPTLRGMASTLVGAVLAGGALHWVSVGDSLLYLVRDGELSKLNKDHSYAGFIRELRAQGHDVEPESDIAPDSLMSAVTGAEISEVDCPEECVELRVGDRIVLASPGIACLDAEGLLACTRRSKNAHACVAALLSDVRAVAGDDQDNTTVIVVDVLGRRPQSVEPSTSGAGFDDPVPDSSADNQALDAPLDTSPPVSSGARLLDVLAVVGAMLVFLGAAAGSWYGLERLDAFRDQTRTIPSMPSAAVDTAAPATRDGIATGGAPA